MSEKHALDSESEQQARSASTHRKKQTPRPRGDNSHLDRLMGTKGPEGVELRGNSEGLMPHDEFSSAADSGEASAIQQFEKETERPSETPMVLKIGNRGERAAAQRLVDRITGYRPQMVEGIQDGLILPKRLAENSDAVDVLGDFLVSAGEQNRTLTDFQRSYQTVRVDAARFNGQLTLVRAQNPGLSGSLVDEWGGQKGLQAQTDRVVEDGAGATHWSAMQDTRTKLESAVSRATSSQFRASAAMRDVTAALNRIEAGVPTMEKHSVEGSEVLATTGAIKKGVGFLVEKSFEHFHIPGASVATKIVDFAVDAVFVQELDALTAKTLEDEHHTQHHASQAEVNALRSSLQVWRAAMVDSYAAQREVQSLKNDLRGSARQFGGRADQKGEFAVSMVADMYAEAEGLSQQLRMAIDLGFVEQTAAQNATVDRATVEGSNAVTKAMRMKPGVTYWEPVKTYSIRTHGVQTVGFSYDASERHAYFAADGLGGTEGAAGVNPVTAQCIQELKDLERVVHASRDQLAGALGFKKESDNAAIDQATSASGPK